MRTRTLRLPDDLEKAVREVGTTERIEEATAMRKLLRMGYEVFIAEQYRAGRVSLRSAAHRMGISMSETMDAFQRLGIQGNATADDTLQSFRSLPAVPAER
jgi:hypothetical protein